MQQTDCLLSRDKYAGNGFKSINQSINQQSNVLQQIYINRYVFLTSMVTFFDQELRYTVWHVV